MAKILIAEDERDIRDLVKFTLQFAGHEVFAAEDGQQAVEMAEEVKPDLILSDIRMPRMTGYEACQRIKSNPAMANVPVVFLSAKGQEAEIQYGLDMGADAYLLKPFEITDLVLQVATLLAKFGKS